LNEGRGPLGLGRRCSPPSNPMVGSFLCCARAASGHAAAPPRNVTNSRRLMGSLTPTITAYHIGIRVCGSEQNWAPMAEVVRSGNSGPAYRRSSLYRHDMLEREVLGANRHEWANGP